MDHLDITLSNLMEISIQNSWERRITRTGMQTFAWGHMNFTCGSPPYACFLTSTCQNSVAVCQDKNDLQRYTILFEIITGGPSNYTMDHPKYIVSNQREE